MQPLNPQWDVANPLSKFPLFQSSDIEEAEDLVSRNFSRHSMDIVASGHDMATQYDGLFFNEMALICGCYGADVKVNPESDRYFFTQTTLRGHTEITLGRDQVQTSEGSTVVVSPATDYRMFLHSGSNRLIVMIERDKMERKLSQLLNREVIEPLRFDLEMNRDSQQSSADAWWRTLSYLTSQLSLTDPLARSEPFLAHASDMLVSQLLTTQPHNYSDLLNQDVTVTGPRHVRRAIAYIEEHMDQSISLADMASAVGVTARTLQKGFLRYLDTTPSEYIRVQRLRRVHEALKHAGDGQQVSQILLNHGVASFGHFSRLYKQQYGCTPSETLARSK
ncbi:AraC family transcriptional regulator [Pseudomaricurvus alkylphenolicus]|uniref:AraC family transcriptional regulator n=1 Tax=Pseudomaricurvus alkylphenolicus TaxID=1306991 RepID=UPI00141F2307|nr:AraC family transcriptional regulator [Pseudomaricurvus alkylphenolicus]NIB40876.1 AraC family transcriptional regulator [Pseudomaricurvus alkylphenolicus]